MTELQRRKWTWILWQAILGASLDENVRMIEESVRWLLENGVPGPAFCCCCLVTSPLSSFLSQNTVSCRSAVHVDLEHFFDGFVEARSGRDVDRDYALRSRATSVSLVNISAFTKTRRSGLSPK